MDILSNLSDTPRSDWVPQQVLTIGLCLEAAESDENLLAELAINPGQVFADAGFPLQTRDFKDFNRFCFEELGLGDVFEQMSSEASFSEINGIECTLCKVGCYTIAAAIVAAGVVGIKLMTVTSAPVVALAAFAGVSAKAALMFIVGLTSVVGQGVAYVASQICQWTKACP